MSISVRKIIDARVDGASSVNQHHDFATGASSTTFQSFEATSKSSGTLEFNVLVPGQNAYWNRRVMLETSVVYTCDVVTNSAIAFPILRAGRDVATCGFPMNSLLQTVVTSINGSTVTTQQNQIMPVVRRLIAANSASQKKYSCPAGVSAYADNAQAGITDANEILSTGRSVDRPNSNGSYRSIQFGTWANGQFTVSETPDSVAITRCTNSADNALTIPADGAGITKSIAFMITTREPLLAAPFVTGDDEPAFTNVQSANIRCSLMQPSDPSVRIVRTNRTVGEVFAVTTDSPGCFTVDDPGTGTAGSYFPAFVKIQNINYASAQPFATARLWCNFLSPSPDQLVPASTIYPYLQFDPLVNAVPVAVKASKLLKDAPVTVPVISQTVVLNTCPDLLAVYAVLSDATEGSTALVNDASTIRSNAAFSGREDLFATISRISIMWNNQPAILASAPINELWRMSYDNGLRYPFDVYTGLRTGGKNQTAVARDSNVFPSAVATTGMPLLLAINKDFPTEPGTAPGVAGVFSLQISADVYYYGMPAAGTSGADQTRMCTLYVVPIRSQYLQLNAGGTSSVVGAVSSGEAMLDAPFADSRVIQDGKSKVQHMTGGWGLPSFAAISSSASNAWKKSKEIAEKAKQAREVYKENEGAIKAALGAMGPTGKKAMAGLTAADRMAKRGTELMDAAHSMGPTGGSAYMPMEKRHRSDFEYAFRH